MIDSKDVEALIERLLEDAKYVGNDYSSPIGNRIEDAATALRALLEERDALKADAERYQWIKANADVILDKEIGFTCFVTGRRIYSRQPAECELDEAIDDALQASKGPR